jgi:lipoyl(octanoyl) transferase
MSVAATATDARSGSWALPGVELAIAPPPAGQPPLRCRWLGRIGFAAALDLQRAIVAEHQRIGDTLLLLEHDPVYTTGRAGKADNLGRLADGGGGEAPLVEIGRGGDVTYHGPGQLVGYALVDLRRRGGDVHRFLRDLERGVIATLDGLGIEATRWPGRTGVWVSSDDVASLDDAAMRSGRIRKIASIGIAVRRGISMHGFALNVGNDLAPFAAIVPCGLAGVRMTSVGLETGRPAPPLDAVAVLAARCLAGVLASTAADRTVRARA